MGYMYLSFAGEDEWFGACIVEADDVVTAAVLAHELGINPGGQVMGFPISPETQLDGKTNHLYKTRDELDAVFGPSQKIVTHTQEETS